MKLTKAQKSLLAELAKDGARLYDSDVGQTSFCLFPAGCKGTHPGKMIRNSTIHPLFMAGIIVSVGGMNPHLCKIATPEETAEVLAWRDGRNKSNQSTL